MTKMNMYMWCGNALVGDMHQFKRPDLNKSTDRQTEKAVKLIDIKSEAIRDILQLVPKDVRVVSLKEDKPSVRVHQLNAPYVH